MQKKPIFTDTIASTAAIPANRFVGMFTGAVCGAAAKAQGVTNFAASAAGEAVAIDILGTSIVETGAAYAKGVPLKSDATGRAIAQAGAGEIIAYASEAVAAAGVLTEVLLAL